ncbi:radical SAM protein [Candidatus Bathyarchaeota archaeon]|nr:radical SAM protein [Candidatus Bathyarchaeota archaeon]
MVLVARINGKLARQPQSKGFSEQLRHSKQEAYCMEENSTAGHAVPWKYIDSKGKVVPCTVYENANFSIYSAAICNGDCPFCVEKLRSLSKGHELEEQKSGIDDSTYFRSMKHAFKMVRSLDPSLSITGGEPSIDPRLPRIIELIDQYDFRKRTMTTNGSGLLDNGIINLLGKRKFQHLNLSRAHQDEAINQSIMNIDHGFSNDDLLECINRAISAGIRPRLSCVLIAEGIHDIEGILEYLEWAATMNVDNVVFRQLMKFRSGECLDHQVSRYSEQARILMDSLLSEIHPSSGKCLPRFQFIKQVVGYYYYIEIYQYKASDGTSIDVVFENADLAFIDIERQKHGSNELIHELVFHPNGNLCSTWQPWNGIVMKATR